MGWSKTRTYVMAGLVLLTLISFVYLLWADIRWTWEGYEYLVGEESPEGLALSILTTGLEVVPIILIMAEAVKDWEKNAMVILLAVAYLVDIGTNFLGIYPRRATEEIRGLSPALLYLLKGLISILLAFVEYGVIWSAQALGILIKLLTRVEVPVPPSTLDRLRRRRA